MITRGKGYLPDDELIVSEQLVSKAAAPHLGFNSGAATVLPRIDYTGLLPFIPDQGPTSSCVGQALATAIYLNAKIAGHPIPRPSAKAIYDFAREEDQPYERLVDSGSRPLAAMNAVKNHGMTRDEDWPILFGPKGDAININDKPLLHVFQNALSAKLDDFYRITAGSGAVELVKFALARGYCPIFSMPVDDIYEQWSDSKIYEGRRNVSLGGHMQAIGGYDDATRSVIVIGSWSRFWANGGLIQISYDYFESGECRDILVPTTAPTIV